MRKATLNYIESELIHHFENKSLINSNLLTDRQRNRMINQVEAVDCIYLRAHDDMKLFIELKYWQNEKWEQTAAALDISKQSCFRLRKIIIARIADEIGLI